MEKKYLNHYFKKNNNKENLLIIESKDNKNKYNNKLFMMKNSKVFFMVWNFVLINLINSVLMKKAFNETRRLNDGLTIDLKINKNGKVRVINSMYAPDKVYLNDTNITIDQTGLIYLENEGINNVTLEWDEKLTSCDRLFTETEGIIEIDFSNFDTSLVTSMKSMFMNCIDLEVIYFNNIETSLVKNMTSMFEGCSSLKSLDLSNFNTSLVKYMDSMFKGCISLTSLNLTSFKTPRLERISEMFYGCNFITNIELSNMNTSKVKDMNSIFYNCSLLTSLNLINFNTAKVITMKELFMLCSSLKSLDLSNFNTINVEDMSYMFSGCSSLTELNISNFSTLKLKNVNEMFSYCNLLTSLDLSNFRTDQVENMISMFSHSSSLISLDLSNFNFSNAKLSNIFIRCKSLKYIIFPKYNKFKGNIDNMFNECSSLSSLNLMNIDFSLTNSMENMFYYCTSLTSLNLSNVDATKVTNMNKMFNGCENLKFLNLTNFITLSVTNMDYMFSDCFSLISLNLNRVNTSLVQNMTYLFSKCMNLISINLTNFNTSLVTSMRSMFEGCSSLTSINLKNFNTSLVEDMENMFYGCVSLTSLDLSNFNTKNVISFENMFYDCTYLGYINFYNYNNESLVKMNEIFYGTDEDLIICIKNGSYMEHLKPKLSSKQCFINDCPNFSHNIEVKIIYDKQICIKDCYYDELYKYEYNNFCYKACPKGSHSLENNEYICKPNVYECIEEYPFLIIDANNCADDCNCKDFFENVCTISNINKKSVTYMINNIISGLQKGLLNHFLENLLNGEKKDLIKIVNNSLFQITTSYNQNFQENITISSIMLGQCENILKNKYNLSQNESLIIFKMEHNIEGLLIPLIAYKIFNPKTKQIMDLNYCEVSNISIQIDIPVLIKENILFKYEQNSSYYEDICYTYTTENNTDITLYDRYIEFNKKNLSLCPSNCIYSKYDYINKKVTCICEIQNNIFLYSDNQDYLIHKFMNIKKNIINFGILQCYKLLFSKEGLLKNFGSYIILLIIAIYLIAAIFIYKKGYNILCYQINNLLNNKVLEYRKKKYCEPKSKKENQINEKSSKSLNIENSLSKSNIEIKLSSQNKDSNHTLNKLESKGTKKKYDYIDYEINNISYKEALENDKRTYLQYYISLIKLKHILLFTFYSNHDYNSFPIKICLCFFSFSLNILINTFFFNDFTLHRIYEDKGKFNFKYILPQIIYSIIICSILIAIAKSISLSQKNILKIKREKNEYSLRGKYVYVIKRLIIKLILFFVISILILILFWYYISSFCAVYKNTQIYLIKNVLISYIISLIYPFITNLLPGIFRIPSLKRKSGECLYKLSQIIQLF